MIQLCVVHLIRAPLRHASRRDWTALTQNLAPGCCMMLNRATAKLINVGQVPEGVSVR